MPWPLPAVVAWGVAWSALRLAHGVDAPDVFAVSLACGLGLAASLWGNSWWRRLLIAGGFPLSWLLVSAPVSAAPWVWLLLLVPLALVYPLNAWKDAPLFPTPKGALEDLPLNAPLPPGALVLDAGCGLGHGLRELRRCYPQARLQGLEWSSLLRFLCAWRCPWAKVQRGDIWKADWSEFDMVYLFQRPESMHRAVRKATLELRAGAWLVSLEFEAIPLTPSAQLRTQGGKMVWLYCAPLTMPPGE
jgi:SAM-dependent methyltransferase